jgi:hypothetical protein
MTVFLVIHGVWLRTEGLFAKIQHVVDEVPTSLISPVQDLGSTFALQNGTRAKQGTVCEGDGGVVVEAK